MSDLVVSLLRLLRLLRRVLVDRAGGDQHALAHAAAQHVEGDESGALAVLDLDFQQGAARDLLQALGGPHVADDDCALHGHSLSISTPSCRALSRASGVNTTPLPTTSFLPALAAAMTFFSVTMPSSIRSLPRVGSVSAELRERFRRNLSRPDCTASRCFGSNASSRRAKTFSSASVATATSSTFAGSDSAARGAGSPFFWLAGAATAAFAASEAIRSRTASGNASRSTCRTRARIASRSIGGLSAALIASSPMPARQPAPPRGRRIRCRSDRRAPWRPSCGSRRP